MGSAARVRSRAGFPVAASCCEYVWFKAPSGSEVVLMVSSWPAPMVMEKALLAIPPRKSDTCTVNGNTPDAEGVPVICPLAAFKLSPGGSVPADMPQR